MSCGARTKTFPPHGASLMCPLGSGGGGGLVIGVDGVGTCCNLRDGTTKHSKKSSWSCHNSSSYNGIVRLIWLNHFKYFI
jgi:hypothetical protein